MMYKIFIGTVIISLVSIFLGFKDANSKLSGQEITKKWKVSRGIMMLSINLLISYLAETSQLGFESWNWNHMTLVFQNIGIHLKRIIWMWVYLQNIYWTTFDLSMNHFSGESWDYISDNQQDHNDSWFDKAFHIFSDSNSGQIQFCVKSTILIVMLILILN